MYEETAGLSCYYAMRNVDKPLVIDGQGPHAGRGRYKALLSCAPMATSPLKT